MSKIVTLEMIKDTLESRNPYYKDGTFRVNGISGRKGRIVTEDIYGVCEPLVYNLYKGFKPGIVAAVDKNKYWISMVKEVHGDVYDYSKVNYSVNRNNVIIICPKHGEFTQTAQGHLTGRGCDACRGDKISLARRYGSVGWETEHWKQKAGKSRHFESFKFYIVRLFDENESFYKLGRTFCSLKRRFGDSGCRYNFEVIKITENKEAGLIVRIEDEIKSVIEHCRYTPIKSFYGKWECFSELDLNRINEKIDIITNSFENDREGL